MDVIKLLKTDHAQVKTLLDELLETTDRAVKAREKLFLKLKEAIKQHEKKEEELLYPSMKEKDKALILKAYEAHRVTDTMIELLEQTPFDDETWRAKLKVLKENFYRHVDEEEKVLFKDVKVFLSKPTLEELGEKMAVISP